MGSDKGSREQAIETDNKLTGKGQDFIKKIFRIRFEENAMKTVNKRDGLYGILFFFYYMVMVYLYGMLLYHTDIYRNLSASFNSRTFFRFLFYLPYTVVSILPIFIILLFRRQGVGTIGIKKDKIGKSILLGIIGSIPFAAMNVTGQIQSGKSLNPNPSDWLWTFLYFLICIAFAEETVFRGFLQTRIYGLVKNKWAGILLAGALFTLIHVPFQMVQANMSIIDFVRYDMQHLITTWFIHIYLVYLYTRDNSIIAPTIAHAIMDFSYEIFI